MQGPHHASATETKIVQHATKWASCTRREPQNGTSEGLSSFRCFDRLAARPRLCSNHKKNSAAATSKYASGAGGRGLGHGRRGAAAVSQSKEVTQSVASVERDRKLTWRERVMNAKRNAQLTLKAVEVRQRPPPSSLGARAMRRECRRPGRGSM